jgi:polyphosphate glucokinase
MRNILSVDVGGTNVKILASGESEPRRFPSGSNLTAHAMVEGVKEIARGWAFEGVSIGYPGPVIGGWPASEPFNLGTGWMGFDFENAFGCPVKLVNDAAMQALGSFNGGRMLFLGLGTGLGSAMVCENVLEPAELAHLPYRKGTYEDYLGLRGLKRLGEKKWAHHVRCVVDIFSKALRPDEIVLGGGNAKRLGQLPPHCRLGDNAYAFTGGFRLWEQGAAKETCRSEPFGAR